MCVQETRWDGSKDKRLNSSLMVDMDRVSLEEVHENSAVDMKRVSDSIMSVKRDIKGVMLNVFSAYAQQVGFQLEEKGIWK